MPQPHPASAKRGKKKERVVLFDQENATAVFRLLYELTPMTQMAIAEYVGISQSAVSGWLSETRQVTFERIPVLAEMFDVSPLIFLRPAPEVEKVLRPELEAVEEFRRNRLAKAREKLATMPLYSQKAVQGRFFDGAGVPEKGLSGRHLSTV